MKKTTKTLVTLVVILAVLVLGYAAIDLVYQDSTETGTGSADEGTETITYVTDLEGIVAFKYSDAEAEMSFAQEEDEWHYEADKTIALDQSLVSTMVSYYQNIVADRTISEPDALADYGLETPSYTVEIQDTEGKVITLYIGNAVDDCYYVTLGEKEVVYTISSSVVSALEFDVENLKEVEETEDTSSEE